MSLLHNTLFIALIFNNASAFATLYTNIVKISHGPAIGTDCGNLPGNDTCVVFSLKDWTGDEDNKAISATSGAFVALIVDGAVKPAYVSASCVGGITPPSYNIGELRKCLSGNNPIGAYVTEQVRPGARLCIQLQNRSNRQPIPINVDCVNAPPPDVSCDIGGPYTINFGTLDADSLNGAFASVTAHASCTGMVSAKVTAHSNDKGDSIALMPGLSGNISVDGVPGSTGSSKAVGPSGTSFLLGTTLHTSGAVAPGSFHGSATIAINID